MFRTATLITILALWRQCVRLGTSRTMATLEEMEATPAARLGTTSSVGVYNNYYTPTSTTIAAGTT